MPGGARRRAWLAAAAVQTLRGERALRPRTFRRDVAAMNTTVKSIKPFDDKLDDHQYEVVVVGETAPNTPSPAL